MNVRNAKKVLVCSKSFKSKVISSKRDNHTRNYSWLIHRKGDEGLGLISFCIDKYMRLLLMMVVK